MAASYLPPATGPEVAPGLAGRRARSGPGRRFAPPPVPLGTVARPALLGRLQRASAALVVVAAPAGYGKTTLLAEWARADGRPFAWIRPSEAHRSPVALRAELLLAAEAAAAGGTEHVVVLDDPAALETLGAGAVLSEALEALPPGGRLALACRALPPLPLGRLRAERRLVRIGPEELALDPRAAASLLRAAAPGIDEDDLAAVVHRAEGWPAMVALAAVALRERGPAAARDFAGDDPMVAEYLVEQLVGRCPPGRVEFLVRTAILERLSGPLCDAVLERTGSGMELRELARAGLPVVPVDRAQEWYRHHRLMAEMLRAELRRREPELERSLHRRAGRWHKAHGDLDEAVRHAHAAGDSARAAELVWASAPEALGRGGLDALGRRLAGFSDAEVAAAAPLALAAGWRSLERGDGAAEDWLSAAQHGGRLGHRAAALALLRAAVARGGVAAMRDDAALAARLEPDGSRWRAVACLLEGVAHDLLGDPARARASLEEGAHRAGQVAPTVAARCLARLAVLALERGAGDEGAALAVRARDLAERHGARDEATMAMVYSVSALVLGRLGRPADAQADLAHTERLLERLGASAPWLAVGARILLARAAVLLGDLARARALIGEAERRLSPAEDAPVLRARLETTLEATRSDPGDASAGGGSLTAAEVRVLRRLPTHLSFREIAAELYVSRFTVKSQALSVYRKLGASSRAEAVERALALGLLAGRP